MRTNHTITVSYIDLMTVLLEFRGEERRHAEARLADAANTKAQELGFENLGQAGDVLSSRVSRRNGKGPFHEVRVSKVDLHRGHVDCYEERNGGSRIFRIDDLFVETTGPRGGKHWTPMREVLTR